MVRRDKTVDNRWEKLYRNEKERYYKWSPSILMNDFLTALRKTEAQKVLDIGCGIGSNAIFLAKEGYYVVGVDISHTALKVAAEQAREHKTANAVFLYADMDSLPFPKGRFDAVFSLNAIHHGAINQIKRRVQNIFEVLSENGVGMVTVSSSKDCKYALGKEIEKNTYEMLEGTHIEARIPHHFFDETEAKLLFGKYFKVTEVKHIVKPVKEGENYHWYISFVKMTT